LDGNLGGLVLGVLQEKGRDRGRQRARKDWEKVTKKKIGWRTLENQKVQNWQSVTGFSLSEIPQRESGFIGLKHALF